MAKSKHDRIAKRIARKRGGQYPPKKGADIVNAREAIEVETDPSGFSEGIRQLQGYRNPRYLAVPNPLVPLAKKRLKGRKTGLMNENGEIVKRWG